MSDLISREKVLNSIEAYCEWCDHHDWCPTCETNDCIQEIKNAPTVDAVPVVRCKDCKYSVDLYRDGGIYCERPNKSTEWHGNNPNYYCADGVRKGNSDE